jgi:hypothetical protein
MTSLQRFRTLLPFMTAIYSKTSSAERTVTLQEGILQLASLVNPGKAEQWSLVRQDVDRLLRLWGVKESDPAATEMATQLLGMIDSFVTDHPEDVTLVIEEKEEPAPAPAPAPAPSAPSVESLLAPALNPFVVFNEEEASPPSNVKVVVIHETPASAITDSAEELEDAEEEEEEDADEVEEEEPSGCLAVSTSLDDEDSEDEGEGNDEDNDGVEVQKMFFKGRSYWLGSDNKVYACADDDEIGDEIGDYNPAEKKPRFY